MRPIRHASARAKIHAIKAAAQEHATNSFTRRDKGLSASRATEKSTESTITVVRTKELRNSLTAIGIRIRQLTSIRVSGACVGKFYDSSITAKISWKTWAASRYEVCGYLIASPPGNATSARSIRERRATPATAGSMATRSSDTAPVDSVNLSQEAVSIITAKNGLRPT